MRKNTFGRLLPLATLLPCFLSAQSGPPRPKDPPPPLFAVIRSGDTAALQKMLSSGTDANTTADGYSALMTAALNGTAEEMKILLQHGARVGYRNADSVTALWLAVPDADKTLLLLAAGADVNSKGKGGYTPVVKLALTPGSAPVMRTFLEKGADFTRSAPDNSLLFNAAGTDDTAMVSICLAQGLRVNDSVSFGNYPIINASMYMAFNTLRQLTEHGANLDAEGFFGPIHNGGTALMNAALAGDRKSFFYLLEHGADPNRRSNKGMTALMYAMQAQEDDPVITKALLDRGASPTEKMSDGSDAMTYAVKMGNTESIALMKNHSR